MSDNGYDIWRDVANILVNPTIKTEMGYRVPTRELARSQKFEYYNPELKGGRKQKDDSAAAAPAAASALAKRRTNYQRQALLQSKVLSLQTLNIISIGKLIFEMIMIISGRLNLLFIK